MNLPNKLTLLRVILILPLVLCLLLPSPQPLLRYVALGIFLVASITDTLDGQIARKRNLITAFGKFLDPVADKMLVLSTMICLCAKGEFPAWLCVLVACRELAVDGLRLIACEKGRVLAAAGLGKIKTTLQMVTLIYALADIPTLLAPEGSVFRTVLMILYYILLGGTALFTLLSAWEYFRKNRDVLKEN